jgi:hypothetical protein
MMTKIIIGVTAFAFCISVAGVMTVGPDSGIVAPNVADPMDRRH